MDKREVNLYLVTAYPCLQFNLALDGLKKIACDCDEAVICLSLIIPLCIPRALVQSRESNGS